MTETRPKRRRLDALSDPGAVFVGFIVGTTLGMALAKFRFDVVSMVCSVLILAFFVLPESFIRRRARDRENHVFSLEEFIEGLENAT